MGGGGQAERDRDGNGETDRHTESGRQANVRSVPF